MNMRKVVELMIVSLALSLVACQAGTAEPTVAPVVDTPVIGTSTAAAYPAEGATVPADPAEAATSAAYPAEAATLPAYPVEEATAAVGEAEPAGFRPPAALTCIDFRNRIARTLAVEATLQEATFEDYVNNRTGQGCQVEATVPGETVTFPAEILTALQEAFAEEGWLEDQSYAADGPTGTATAFSNSDRTILCLLNVNWEQAENSPYTVTYNCALDESAVTTPGFESGIYQALPEAACNELRALVENTLNVDATLALAAPFADFATSQAGQGCQITATGTGADFTSQVDVANELQTALEAQGWQVDMMRAADGPTETALGFEKDNQVCILGAGWEPSYEAYVGCTEELLLGCDIVPEEQNYTISLTCAEQ